MLLNLSFSAAEGWQTFAMEKKVLQLKRSKTQTMMYFQYEALNDFFTHYYLFYIHHKQFEDETALIKHYQIASPEQALALLQEINAILAGANDLNQGEITSQIRSLPRGFSRIKPFRNLAEVLTFLELIKITLEK